MHMQKKGAYRKTRRTSQICMWARKCDSSITSASGNSCAPLAFPSRKAVKRREYILRERRKTASEKVIPITKMREKEIAYRRRKGGIGFWGDSQEKRWYDVGSTTLGRFLEVVSAECSAPSRFPRSKFFPAFLVAPTLPFPRF